MTSKFFRPAKAASAFCLLWCGVNLGTACAQEPASPTPSPTPKQVTAYVRFWNLLPLKSGYLELVGAADPLGKSLLSASPGAFAGEYRPVPPARYSWAVCRAGDRKQPLKNPLDVPLRAEEYLTIVTRPSADPGGEPVVELVDDTIDPDQPSSNNLTIYQCSPDVKAVVTAARRYTSDPVVYGSTQSLKDLPKGVVGLSISLTTKTGPASWNTDADFRASPHASLIVVPDAYGRIRPRVTVDGATRNAAVPSDLPKVTTLPSSSASPNK